MHTYMFHNQETSLIRTLYSVPRVSGLERFHCSLTHSLTHFSAGTSLTSDSTNMAQLSSLKMMVSLPSWTLGVARGKRFFAENWGEGREKYRSFPRNILVCVMTFTIPVHLDGTNFAPFLLLTRRCYDAETSVILLLLKRAFE